MLLENFENKLYTKDELLKITEYNIYMKYTVKENGEMFDYYLPSDVENVELDDNFDLDKELENNNVGFIYLPIFDALPFMESEANERIWICNNLNTDNPKVDILLKKYNLKPEDCDQFYLGYWSGILATCRFLTESDSIDESRLRDPSVLTDIKEI